MRNSDITLLVFGAPSSGKTVFQTGLWALSDQSNVDDHVNQHFREIRDGLMTGNPTQATIRSKELPPKNTFILERQRNTIVKTIDYAGEDAERFLKENGGHVRTLLVEADAVLLLLDSFSLAKAGDVQDWFNTHGYDKLFHWISEVLGGRHTKGLPFTIALSRSDLVNADTLTHFKKEVTSKARAYGLEPAVRDLSLFGEHKAIQAVPNFETSPLPLEFQCPRESLQLNEVEDIVIGLINKHKRTRKKPLLIIVLLVFVVIGSISLGTELLTREKPVKLEEVQNALSTSPDLLKFTFPDLGLKNASLEDLHRGFRDEVERRGSEEGFRVHDLDELFTKHVSDHLKGKIKEAQILKYDTLASEWKYFLPRDYIEYYENNLYSGAKDKTILLSVTELKKEELDRIVAKGLKGYSTQAVDDLIYQYVLLRLEPPEGLSVKYEIDIREDFINDLADMLDSHREDLPNVYFKEIPDLLGRNLSGIKTNRAKVAQFEQEVIELQNYIRLLEKFKDGPRAIVFTLTRVDRIGDDDHMPEKIYINSGNVRTPFDGNPIGVSVNWTIGEPFKIEMIVDHGGNYYGRDLNWMSDSGYTSSFINKNYDVPGLSFLIIRDAMENPKRFKFGKRYWIGKKASDAYKLDIQPSKELAALSTLPRLLVEANKRRKEGD
jgi:hypothetical protein